jgi:hypothetical protein
MSRVWCGTGSIVRRSDSTCGVSRLIRQRGLVVNLIAAVRSSGSRASYQTRSVSTYSTSLLA